MRKWSALFCAAGCAALVAACAAPGDQQTPRRLVTPGEFYVDQVECMILARSADARPQEAVTPRQEVGRHSENPRERFEATMNERYDLSGHERDEQRYAIVVEEAFEDCMRAKGWRWYLERLRALR